MLLKSKWYQAEVEDVYSSVGSSAQGLSSVEAQLRLSTYGKNVLLALKKKSAVLMFLSQFYNVFSLLLGGSAAISLYLNSYSDAIVLGGIMLINATIGFIQEFKSDHVIESLKEFMSKEAKVMRDGQEVLVPASDLVPGDIVHVSEGDSVPADIRLHTIYFLQTNEFALTGESRPTKKILTLLTRDVSIADQANMLFLGTTVFQGDGYGVVIATGMQTELGKIAHLSQEVKSTPSPLEITVNDVARRIGIVCVVISVVLFVITQLLGQSFRDGFILAIAIAAACVPQGLPSQITVGLSLGARRLANKRAIVKKLSAVETLGSATVICTDKTGTLTKNEMTIQKVYVNHEELIVHGVGYVPHGDIVHDGVPLRGLELSDYDACFTAGALASTSSLHADGNDDTKRYVIGDPTEAACVVLAEKVGKNQEYLKEHYPIEFILPFDSTRKRMSCVRGDAGKRVMYMKGSPESVLARCTSIYLGKNTARAMTDEDRQQILAKNDEYSSEALRVLGYAVRDLSDGETSEDAIEDLEKGMTFLGLVAMMDPPRDDVRDAIKTALNAHIRVIMITGDYALTAKAIAERIGMFELNPALKVFSGEDIRAMDDATLTTHLAAETIVFSRVNPEDKLRLVTLLQAMGEVVAVTGDGANDAPALKKAEIGVAMGKTGTDVAKDAAEIVLLDDSFSSLVAAIEGGRAIFHNIKNQIITSLELNSAELWTILLGFILIPFGLPLPILALQILAIDLIAEMPPQLAMSWDPLREGVMRERPRNIHEHILDKSMYVHLLSIGWIIAAFAILNFLLFLIFANGGWSNTLEHSNAYMIATAMTYLTLVLCQYIDIFSRRAGNDSVFNRYLTSNPYIFMSIGISLFLVGLVIYHPVLQQFFQTGTIPLEYLLYPFVSALIFLLYREVMKIVETRKHHS